MTFLLAYAQGWPGAWCASSLGHWMDAWGHLTSGWGRCMMNLLLEPTHKHVKKKKCIEILGDLGRTYSAVWWILGRGKGCFSFRGWQRRESRSPFGLKTLAILLLISHFFFTLFGFCSGRLCNVLFFVHEGGKACICILEWESITIMSS